MIGSHCSELTAHQFPSGTCGASCVLCLLSEVQPVPRFTLLCLLILLSLPHSCFYFYCCSNLFIQLFYIYVCLTLPCTSSFIYSFFYRSNCCFTQLYHILSLRHCFESSDECEFLLLWSCMSVNTSEFVWKRRTRSYNLWQQTLLMVFIKVPLRS